MGAICAGGSNEPDLDVNSDEINEMINESLDAVAAKSKENFETFKAGIEGAGDEAFKVPDSDPEVELNKESTDQDVGKAAVAAAFAGVDMAELKANIWKKTEEHLDAQLEAKEEAQKPDEEQTKKDKDYIKNRNVDEAVDKAFADKRAELEKSYEPEPEESEEKPAEEEKKEDDAKEDDKKEDNKDGDGDDAAKEEDKAADDGAKAEEEAPTEDAAGADSAPDDAGDDAGDE